ncbi:MAG: threonine synthase [Planctomycetota bacterium]
MSPLQEKQLTTLGGNVSAIEVSGTFDDCQRLVKSAFADRPLSQRHNLTSANSINISRLIPQSFYYFDAARQLEVDQHPCFIVPSGNFGNLTAGLLAQRMGLPVAYFVAATNTNDVVPQYLREGTYLPRPSVATLSNAMDVGAPSNFARMVDLFARQSDPEGDQLSDVAAHPDMSTRISGVSFDDQQTKQAIRQVWDRYGYAMCPHTAVGYLAAQQQSGDGQQIILATAHPSKFLPTMESVLGDGAVEIPLRLACLADRAKVAVSMQPDEATFFEYLNQQS